MKTDNLNDFDEILEMFPKIKDSKKNQKKKKKRKKHLKEEIRQKILFVSLFLLIIIIFYFIINTKNKKVKIVENKRKSTEIIKKINEIKLYLNNELEDGKENNYVQILGENYTDELPSQIIDNNGKNYTIKNKYITIDDFSKIEYILLKFSKKIEKGTKMFEGIKEFDEIDLSSFDTSYMKDMTSMFENSNFKNITFSRVYDANGEANSKIIFNTRNVTFMIKTFKNMKNIKSLDLINFSSGKLISTRSMFEECDNLEIINFPIEFDIKNVKNIDRMFFNNKKLKVLKINKFDLGNVETFNNIFDGCRISIINIGSLPSNSVLFLDNLFEGIKDDGVLVIYKKIMNEYFRHKFFGNKKLPKVKELFVDEEY